MRFLEDCRVVLDVWVRRPSLFFITFALDLAGVLPSFHPAALLVGLPGLLFGMGWLGTQRVWYARLFEDADARLGRREAWLLTWSMLGRLLPLGIVVVVAGLPALFVGVALDAPVLVVAWAVGIDVVLTFVVPALVLHTDEVGQAVRQGLAMLRSTWPRCAWHAIAPPLALQLLSRSGTPPPATAVAIAAVTSPIALLARGAILRFYLEQRPAVRLI